MITATDNFRRTLTFRSAGEVLRWLSANTTHAGWHRKPEDVYLPMEPHAAYWLQERTGLRLHPDDLGRVRLIQSRYRALLHHVREVAPGWSTVERIHWADNSIERIEEDRDGNRRTVMDVAPHGDLC